MRCVLGKQHHRLPGDDPKRGASPTAKSLHVNGDMPVASAWHSQPGRRATDQATIVAVTAARAVALKVRVIEKPDVCCTTRERDLYNSASRLVPEVVVVESHCCDVRTTLNMLLLVSAEGYKL